MGLCLALARAPAWADDEKFTCGRDSVPVGPVCVDKYEASVWEVPPANTRLIKKIKNGRATLADLTAGGATQVSPSDSCSPAFPSTFDLTGN